MQGKTGKRTFDELMEQAQGSRYAANRLLRTETNYITNQATAEAYEQAGIERYRFMAVLDGRTSPMCQQHDGHEYALAEKEIGVNYPPLHPWCRSTVEPVIDGISREHMQRWARDPETGEQMKVPRDMTYKEWREWHKAERPNMEAWRRNQLTDAQKEAIMKVDWSKANYPQNNKKFTKHMDKYPAGTTAEQYENRAKTLLAAPIDSGKPAIFRKADNVVERYSYRDNEIVIASLVMKEIKTSFIPDEGITYWRKEYERN